MNEWIDLLEWKSEAQAEKYQRLQKHSKYPTSSKPPSIIQNGIRMEGIGSDVRSIAILTSAGLARRLQLLIKYAAITNTSPSQRE